MAQEAGGTAAPVDNSPSLASVVGEFYGDFSSVEPDEVEEAPSSSTTEDTTAEPEGTDATAELTAEPATEPAPASPDTAASSTQAEPDPLEGSSPLAYTVNGESRTSDGITLLKDGGAIVDPDKVQWLQQRLSERDHLYEKDQSLARLSQFSFTGQDGKPVTLMGADAIRHRDNLLASAGAQIKATEGYAEKMIQRIMAYVPEAFVTVDPNTNAVSWNQAAFAEIRKMVEGDVGREANLLAREYHMNTAQRWQSAPSQPSAQPMTQADIVASAPATVDAVLSALKISNLTTEDKTELASVLVEHGYVRTATAQDVQRDPSLTVGRPFVDPRFATFPRRLSAARGDAQKVAAGVTKVDAKNAARLAAASQGRNGKSPARIPPQKEKAPSQQDNFDQAYDMREKAAAGVLRAQAFGGR